MVKSTNFVLMDQWDLDYIHLSWEESKLEPTKWCFNILHKHFPPTAPAPPTMNIHKLFQVLKFRFSCKQEHPLTLPAFLCEVFSPSQLQSNTVSIESVKYVVNDWSRPIHTQQRYSSFQYLITLRSMNILQCNPALKKRIQWILYDQKSNRLQ